MCSIYWGVHLPSIYMHCPRSSSGCSGMKDFYIQMTWEDLCCMVLCFANVFGVVVFNSHMLDRLRGPSAFLYICIVLDLALGVVVCMASVLNWLGAICLLYICIVIDLALGVVVCMASVLNWLGRATWSVMVFNTYMLDWLGGPSAFYIYALSLI